MTALADFLRSFLILPEGCVPSLVPGAWEALDKCLAGKADGSQESG